MKHPNCKVELLNRFRTIINKKSCFNYWITKNKRHIVQLTDDALLSALIDIRRGGKTVSVELADL